ncbi:MAG: 3D domain-containing protein [Patescibacteria group bacterium]|nr:3D domain-containing protein [Patescibacteria group bacterium]
MSKLLFVIFLIISFYFSNQAVSPTTATIEPIILEENIFLNQQNIKIKNIKEYWVIITGYSSSYDETDDTPYITASGEWVTDGIVASNFLPFGTKILIPEIFGNKIFIVKDRMNDRFEDRIDIWFPSKWEAINFGKKYSKIIILSN